MARLSSKSSINNYGKTNLRSSQRTIGYNNLRTNLESESVYKTQVSINKLPELNTDYTFIKLVPEIKNYDYRRSFVEMPMTRTKEKINSIIEKDMSIEYKTRKYVNVKDNLIQNTNINYKQQIPKQITDNKTIVNTKTDLRMKTTSELTQRTNIATELRTEIKSEINNPLTNIRTNFKSPITNIPPPPPPPRFPRTDFFGRTETKKTTQKQKSKKSKERTYSPSIYAITFQKKGTPHKLIDIASGLGIQPIPTKKWRKQYVKHTGPF
jgi:hypothetical protein